MNSPVRIAGTLDEPGPKEPLMAAAIHIISIFSPLWGPLIGWGLFRNSKPFVGAHAWAALAEFIVLKAVLLFLGAISLGFTIYKIVYHMNNGWETFDWGQLILRFLAAWVFLFILGAITTVLSLKQALLAYNGHWPKRDVKKAQRAIER